MKVNQGRPSHYITKGDIFVMALQMYRREKSVKEILSTKVPEESLCGLTIQNPVKMTHTFGVEFKTTPGRYKYTIY